MLNHILETTTPIVIHILEIIGVIIIFIGGITAFYRYLVSLIKRTNYPIKIKFAESLTLALEFKMGAEILKTLLVRTMDEMFILAAIIFLRAILAAVLHWELKSEKNIDS